MSDVLYIIVVICLLAIWVPALLFSMQMFQQNSYKVDRFLRWSHGKVFRKFWKRGTKVKFVMTPRMWRLFFTATLIFAVLCIFRLYIPAALALIFTDYTMILANALNVPINKAVSNWYVKDAKRILAAHKDLVIIGVTGSYGKTSTKNYLYRMLSEKYNTLITPGNFNTTMGVVRTIREYLKPYHQVFIVEMGAKQVGDIKEICDLVHPVIGVVTSVGQMHLETFKTVENIRKTKFELIRSLPSDGLGVINMDSEGIESYGDIPDNCRIARYGIKSEAVDYKAENISCSASGTDFDVNGTHIHTSLVGDCNILNILAAVAVADRLEVSADKQRIAASKLQQVEHRLSVSLKGGMTILDDAYNSNPEGARMALDVLGRLSLPDGARRIVVTPGFVELGARQESEDRLLGEEIAGVADILIIVNRYNRDALFSGARSAGMPEDRIICADTLAGAVQHLSGLTKPGDAILYENDLPDTFK